mmetsp:Transcript_28677/g.92317  ORF Transcript_28677/g.92317 Transcript_28677/m.92317 type:complete len:203 (+) Transcript_28677:303-911(+)
MMARVKPDRRRDIAAATGEPSWRRFKIRFHGRPPNGGGPEGSSPTTGHGARPEGSASVQMKEINVETTMTMSCSGRNFCLYFFLSPRKITNVAIEPVPMKTAQPLMSFALRNTASHDLAKSETLATWGKACFAFLFASSLTSSSKPTRCRNCDVAMRHAAAQVKPSMTESASMAATTSAAPVQARPTWTSPVKSDKASAADT